MTRLLCSLCLIAIAFGLLVSGCALDPMERLKEKADSQDPRDRSAAILELANLRDDRAIEQLADLLESDEEVYDAAGVALVKQGRDNATDKKPDPITAMVAAIMNNVHLSTANRCRAAWVLGEIGDREAIPELRKGTSTKDAAGAACVPVNDQAKLALKKLGNDSDGAPFEIAMDALKGEVTVLPEVKSVAPPEAADATAPADAKPKAAEPAKDAKTPAKT
jgi:HEAT repeat protein